MDINDLALIIAAMRRGYLTQEQAAAMRAEIEASPARRAHNLLVKRAYLSQEQLEELLALLESERSKAAANLVDRAVGQATTRLPAATAVPNADPGVRSGHSAPMPMLPAAGDDAISGTATTAPLVPQAPVPEPFAVASFSCTGAPVAGSLADLLRFAREQGCTDLHISPGRPPFVRHTGDIHYLSDVSVTKLKADDMNLGAVPSEIRHRLPAMGQLEFALEIPRLGRHRCSVFRQRLGWDGVYRIVPVAIPALEQTGLPPVLRDLVDHRHGLILVTGPARSGKTTSLAALIQHINTTRADHIITVEDPIEFVVEPVRCRITQREVGAHTRGFADALAAAVHQDPDVIMVGDLRDHDTTSIAVGAAESGHLVLGSLHTHTATRTVARMLEMYPARQRDEIATMLASSMRGVASQKLLPRADGRGLVLAVEVLILTPAVAQAIRDHKAAQIYNLMQSGKRIGMRTMDDALMELAGQGAITAEMARDHAENKRQFEVMHRGGAA